MGRSRRVGKNATRPERQKTKFARGTCQIYDLEASFGISRCVPRKEAFHMVRIYTECCRHWPVHTSRKWVDVRRLCAYDGGTFPHRAPDEGDPWYMQDTADCVDELVNAIFTGPRDAPQPVKSRRYSVEMDAWRMSFLGVFSLSPRLLTMVTNTARFWHGGDMGSTASLPLRDVEAGNKERKKLVIDFIASDECYIQAIAVSIASIPRWGFARGLFRKAARLSI